MVNFDEGVAAVRLFHHVHVGAAVVRELGLDVSRKRCHVLVPASHDVLALVPVLV